MKISEHLLVLEIKRGKAIGVAMAIEHKRQLKSSQCPKMEQFEQQNKVVLYCNPKCKINTYLYMLV